MSTPGRGAAKWIKVSTRWARANLPRSQVIISWFKYFENRIKAFRKSVEEYYGSHNGAHMNAATKLQDDLTQPASATKAPSALQIKRALRREDERVRYTLGLVYVGIRYGQYNQAPREMYRSATGRYFVKVSEGVYEIQR